MPTVKPLIPATAVLVGLLSVSACASANYATRMAYLRKVANRGVETHNLLASQGAKIDAKRCTEAYHGLRDDSHPTDESGQSSEAWLNQIQQFFVDSCVTGYPKPVPGGTPQPPPKVSPSPAAPTVSASPSPTKHT